MGRHGCPTTSIFWNVLGTPSLFASRVDTEAQIPTACIRWRHSVESVFSAFSTLGAAKMRIDYHDLNEKDFERLIVAICAEILGSGVVPFCSGPDGSRDARFEGTASDLPNSVDPHK